ncbi:MAG: rhomboid family intramembrane serine protease [Candidatus Rokubacteria bacterium]|nr:rhomboid family intramembrane serine protease [Candidatus Rokubacteria bacterium]
MFDKRPTRTILCPSCGRLTRADADECLSCGRRRPGMFGLSDALRRLFRLGGVTNAITVACVAIYVASLLLDPRAALRPRLGLDFLPVGNAVVAVFGTGAFAWRAGRWWTLITAIYIHGNLLHILFNMLWVRQLSPAIEELYGPARLVVIFTVAGITGFLASTLAGEPLTIGASGAVFGLLGAIVAFGHRRGGVFGSMILRQYGQWALVLFVFGFVMPGVDNFAHAGGFVGGLGAGLVLSLAERRRETGADHMLAALAVLLTLAAFALAIASIFG